jgi:hypothetical protein
MDSKNKVVEAVLVALALGLFLGYHVWFFFVKTEWTKTKDNYYGINGKGKIARLIFTQIVSSQPKNAILGIQQARLALTPSFCCQAYGISAPYCPCSLSIACMGQPWCIMCNFILSLQLGLCLRPFFFCVSPLRQEAVCKTEQEADAGKPRG